MVVFKDFNNLDCYFDVILLNKHNFFKIYSLPDTCIDIKWKSFEEYLKSLKRKQRANIIRKLNRFKEKKEVKIEMVDDFSSICNKLYSLYENTYNKSPIKFEKLTPHFF